MVEGPSKISGPIPPHPHYQKGETSVFVNLPIPRVRPEAKDFAEQGRGIVKMLLQVEGQRVPSASRRMKPEPKDHISENVRRMRQIQRKTRKVEETKAEPVKGLWKSSKYETVVSRIRDDMEREPPTPRPHSANFLRAHSRTGFNPSPRFVEYDDPPEDKLTVPTAESARDVRFVRRELDFIKVNGCAVKHPAMKRSPSLTALDDMKSRQDELKANYKKGEVPKYLVSRKKEWVQEEEDRVASIPDPDMPPDHRMMPDHERRATLDKLLQTEAELLQQLNSMPIRTDTMRIRSRKNEIERKLAEVEEAKKIFSRPKVFVKLDD